MIDIHVEAHADSIRSNQIIDFARLVHANLRVSCARAEGAQNNGCTTSLSPYKFGNCIYVRCAERHDCRASWKLVCLARSDMGQNWEPRARYNFGIWDQLGEQISYTFCTHEHRFGWAAWMQEPVSEDMASIRISTHLNFINANKCDIKINGHRFNGAKKPAWTFW